MLLLPEHINTQTINCQEANLQNIKIDILRLDNIHPIVSGNKLFKLHYFLNKAIQEHKTILTFGGAFSNHLIATAFACKEMNIKCIGVVRGEKPEKFSYTLQQCKQYGMQLIFISRKEYDKKNYAFLSEKINIDEYMVIPEGGYHPLGAKGASLIGDHISGSYTHICTSIGTATTLAGLLLNSKSNQKVIGFNALKGLHDINERINYLTENKLNQLDYTTIEKYHFGGYAKKNTALLNFMNKLWEKHQIPTDFVYTAKMIFGVFDLIDKSYFPSESKIIVLHTGGLQGNNSFPKNTLTF